MREAVRARVDDGAAEAERALVEWIAEVEPGRPFFWFVNLMECHSPYLPPRPYNDLGSLDRLRAGLEAQRHLTLDAIWRTCLGVAQVPDAALERMRHLYTRSIRYMDDWLGRVLERLETRGALADTMVLVTSDHGENFGDGGLIAHGFSLDDRLLHVPLVATGPGSEALPDRLVSLGELPRMLAGVAGIPDHPWDDDDLPPAGIAVAQLNPPLDPENPDLKTMQREWGLERTGIDRLTARFECATDGRLKLVRGEGRELLYDLEADPLELAPHPVEGSRTTSTASSTAIAALRRAIDHPAARPRSGADAEAVQTPTDEETAAIEERMRLLGYL
jgi:arylsulfatase A-like enzyme